MFFGWLVFRIGFGRIWWDYYHNCHRPCPTWYSWVRFGFWILLGWFEFVFLNPVATPKQDKDWKEVICCFLFSLFGCPVNCWKWRLVVVVKATKFAFMLAKATGVLILQDLPIYDHSRRHIGISQGTTDWIWKFDRCLNFVDLLRCRVYEVTWVEEKLTFVNLKGNWFVALMLMYLHWAFVTLLPIDDDLVEMH